MIKNSVKKAVLYKEEKLYDRLLEYVKSQCNIWTLKQYERDLQPQYSGELLEIYTQVVQEMAKVSGDRKKYREIVKVLRKMKHYPNGVNRVKHIVDDWKIRYKNRPAMMDEMDRL